MDAEFKRRANPPENVRRLHKGVNVAVLGLLLHAIRGVDQSLPHNMLHGFPIIRDVPDSGVYRATDHPLTLDEFCDVYDAIMLKTKSGCKSRSAACATMMQPWPRRSKETRERSTL